MKGKYQAIFPTSGIKFYFNSEREFWQKIKLYDLQFQPRMVYRYGKIFPNLCL
jgi:hypothetical protein